MSRIKDHAIVNVNSKKKELIDINGKEGFILERDEETNLCILNIEGEEYWVDEEDLIDTGRIKALPKPKFAFYEIIKVDTNDAEYSEINGCEGIIRAMSQEIDGSWGYGVRVNHEGWNIPEYALKKTGRFVSKDDLHTGSYLKVSIKGELTGGHLVGYDDEDDNNKEQ